LPVQRIILPVWEKSAVPIRTVQGEAESRTVQATLTDADGGPVDLTGADARLYIRKPDGTVVFLDGSITDAAGGICAFRLPSGVTAAAGIAYGQILVTWSGGRSLKAEELILEIRPSDLEKAVEASDDFSALTAALSSMRQFSATAEQASADAQKAVADAQKAFSDIQTAVAASDASAAAANNAAVSAGSAASAANQAVQSAASFYQMVNPLTGQTAFVTDIIDGLTAYIFRDSVSAQAMDEVNKAAQDFDKPAVSALEFDTGAKKFLGVL
jgi:hypothetical protein